MAVLVACEESQAVTIELRKRGIEAYSCDTRPSSGGHPEWHLQQDVAPLLRETWDAIIAFPPCTHLAVSGAAWFARKRESGEQQAGIDFFMQIATAPCPRIAIENPVGIMSTLWRNPDQVIQPWQYGHTEQKATCLWLKGLPLLRPTRNVYATMIELPRRERERLHFLPPSPERAALRSKTYPGIARAMAEQWGEVIINQSHPIQMEFTL